LLKNIHSVSKIWNRIAVILAISFVAWIATIIISTERMRDSVVERVSYISELTKLESQIMGTEVFFNADIRSDSLRSEWEAVFQVIKNKKNTLLVDLRSIANSEELMDNLDNAVNSLNNDYLILGSGQKPKSYPSLIKSNTHAKIQDAAKSIRTIISKLRGQLGKLSYDLGKQWDQLYILAVVSIFLAIVTVILISKSRNELEKRKSAEEQISLLSHAIVQSPAAILITDLEGKIEYINPKYTEVTGYKMEEALGEIPSFLIPEEQDAEVYKVLWKTISAGKEWRGKLQNIRKSGELFWEFNYISSISDENGKMIHYLAVKEDMTERLLLENRMALSQKLESIGQLASGVAHEINTPLQFIGDNLHFLNGSLSSIMEYVALLEGNLNSLAKKVNQVEYLDNFHKKAAEYDIDFLKDEIPSALEQSNNGLKKVRKIVLAIKNFAHPGDNEKSDYDLNEGIKVTTEVSRNSWKYAADLELSLAEDIPLVYCDGDQINQAILNLLINAAHAIEENHETNGEEKGKIIIGTIECTGGVEIKITDSGKGIPSENLQKIFDPFFTTKEVGRGTGQGLSIVYDIVVNKHNGKLDVDSTLGKGTSFKLFLPTEKT